MIQSRQEILFFCNSDPSRLAGDGVSYLEGRKDARVTYTICCSVILSAVSFCLRVLINLPLSL